MRHRKKGKILGRKKASREALVDNLVTSFVLYEKIKTTPAKAKVVRSVAEKCVTLGKKNTLHARRQLLKVLYTEGAVNKVLEVIAPRYKERIGGYTRVIKMPSLRVGDGSKMVQLEFV